MNLKSDRLKKFENEFHDLEQWLKLGLVPKKDIPKHKEEIEAIRHKIEEEKQRLRFIKESGDVEEYLPPKRTARTAYQEPQSIPDMPAATGEESDTTSFDMETSSYDTSTSAGEDTSSTTSESAEEDVSSQIYDEDDDPFSDKNRWKRGILEDPDANEW